MFVNTLPFSFRRRARVEVIKGWFICPKKGLIITEIKLRHF